MKSESLSVYRGIPAAVVWVLVSGGFLALPLVVAGVLAPLVPAWMVMGGIAGAMFFALKLLTLADHGRAAISWRGAAYVVVWPGLNARRFLADDERADVGATMAELGVAMGKMMLGSGLFVLAVVRLETLPVWAAGWVAMVGIIFTLHFGAMHVASWIWRRAGVNAPPIMNAPMRAVSLVEFWSERWNVAFADVARRFVFRPLARRWGALKAGGVVFLLSGLVHEAAISLPARGGWGGPTLYFALHTVGIAIERSRAGVAAGLGRGLRGWLWVLGFTVLPLPVLFHAPFVGRVIVPMLKDFNLFLP
jgi:hypothetical protein